MLKWVLIGVGVLVLGVIALAGLGWMAVNKSIDPKTEGGQAYAQSFKREFTESCTREAARSASGSVTEDDLRQLCACAADLTYEAYKDQPPIKLISIGNDPEVQQKVVGFIKECVERAGLQ